MSDVLSAIATTFDGATSAGDLLVERDERRRAAAIGKRPVGQVVEVVVGHAGLVDHDHRVGRGAVDEARA